MMRSMNVAVRNPLPLTYADYVHLPDDGNSHEIICGDHYTSPAPNIDHQVSDRDHLYWSLGSPPRSISLPSWPD